MITAKAKIWSWKHNSGRRIWYYKCYACTHSPCSISNAKIQSSSGMSPHWKVTLETALQHIQVYHVWRSP